MIIEIPIGGEPVKYEVDKASGALFVYRFLQTAMNYPCNYDFVPHTLAEDGGRVNELVAGRNPVIPEAEVCVRLIGALILEDEAGMEEKILAVPVDALNPYFPRVFSF